MNIAEVPILWEPGMKILDLYEVLEVHEGGGMGLVYRVHHTGWNIDLAVKTPRSEFFTTDKQRENFTHECESWIALGMHPYIVSCFFVRTLGGVPRVFAEYIEGGSLHEWMHDGRLYRGHSKDVLKRIFDISIQTAWGLDYAHEKGMIHQDVKPANIMLSPSGVAKVTDFGLVQARGMSDEESITTGTYKSILVTSGGRTPAYCSPEQFDGKKLSRKTDIWSWGVSVLEMFTGEVTWIAGQLADFALEGYMVSGVDNKSIPPMPEALADLLRLCFKPEPNNRPASMAEIKHELCIIYREIFGEDSIYAEMELVSIEASGLNNHAISLEEIGRHKEAKVKLREALALYPSHLELTYNLSLMEWRDGEIDDMDVLRKLNNLRNNFIIDRKACDEMIAKVHAERFSKEELEVSLNDYPDLYDSIVGDKDIGGIKYVKSISIPEGDPGVFSLKISPDGKYIITIHALYQNAYKEKCIHLIKIWDLFKNGPELQIIKVKTDISNPVDIAITPDSKYVISYNYPEDYDYWCKKNECSLSIWNIETGKREKEKILKVEKGDWHLIEGGRYIVTYHEFFKTIRVYDINTKEIRGLERPNVEDMIDIIISKDNNYFIINSSQKNEDSKTNEFVIEIFKFADFDSVFCLNNATLINVIGVTPKSNYLIVTGNDKNIQLWNVRNGKSLKPIKCDYSNTKCLAFSNDETFFVSNSIFDNTIRVFDIETGKCLKTLKDNNDKIDLIELSDDDKYIITGSYDNSLIMVWDIRTGDCINKILGYAYNPKRLSVSPKGNYLVLTSSRYLKEYRKDYSGVKLCVVKNNIIKIININTGVHIKTICAKSPQTAGFNKESVMCPIVFTPDNKLLLICGFEMIGVYDLQTGERTNSINSPNVTHCSITSDGDKLIMGRMDGFEIWDLINNKHIFNYEYKYDGYNGLNRVLCELKISSDGNKVILCITYQRRHSSNEDICQEIGMFDVNSNKFIWTELNTSISKIIMLRNNTNLIYQEFDDTHITVLDINNKDKVSDYITTSGFEVLCVTPDSNNIIGLSDYGIISMRIDTGQYTHNLLIKKDTICNASDDGRYILLSKNKIVTIWSIDLINQIKSNYVFSKLQDYSALITTKNNLNDDLLEAVLLLNSSQFIKSWVKLYALWGKKNFMVDKKIISLYNQLHAQSFRKVLACSVIYNKISLLDGEYEQLQISHDNKYIVSVYRIDLDIEEDVKYDADYTFDDNDYYPQSIEEAEAEFRREERHASYIASLRRRIVQIIDFHSGKPLHTINAEKNSGLKSFITPDSKAVIISYNSRNIEYDLESGEIISLKSKTLSGNTIFDGNFYYEHNCEYAISIYHILSNEVVFTSPAYFRVKHVIITTDYKYFIFISDSQYEVYDISSKELLRQQDIIT